MRTEAEPEGLQPQAKDAWSPRELEGAGRTVPQSLQREPGPVTPGLRISRLQNCEGINFCRFKLLSLC